MSFSETLDKYIALVNCSAKELSERSGLSAATISRYRTGDRCPASGGSSVRRLALALAALAERSGEKLTADAVLAELEKALAENVVDDAQLVENLNCLITVLRISMTELSKSLSFDASYLSRIRSGQRRPSDSEAFAEGVARYVARRCVAATDRDIVTHLLGYDTRSLGDDYSIVTAVKEWLLHGKCDSPDNMQSFLKKLDEFDLGEYVSSMNFDGMRLPSGSFHFSSTRKYYGLDAYQQAELDFLRITAQSKSGGRVIMYSDMPMADIAKDINMVKAWMTGVAVILKNGMELSMIHAMDRPFDEMMLGLESWIPLYMTGRISPYYLKDMHDPVFNHLIYSSAAAVLEGQSIVGSHELGRYILSTADENVSHGRTMAECLLEKAEPLMDIYTKAREKEFFALVRNESLTKAPRRGILCTLPVHTLSQACLNSILDHNNVSGAERADIMAYVRDSAERMETLLENGTLTEEIPAPTEEEFNRCRPVLPLAALFFERDVFYSYEDYQEHLRLTQEYAYSHENYRVMVVPSCKFRNIQIRICKGRWVVISKNSSPVIHFVIRHPKLCHVIENMIVPAVE